MLKEIFCKHNYKHETMQTLIHDEGITRIKTYFIKVHCDKCGKIHNHIRRHHYSINVPPEYKYEEKKYMEKPKIISAVPYKQGMEDGLKEVDCRISLLSNSVIAWYGEIVANDNTNTVEIPYLNMGLIDAPFGGQSSGWCYIHPNDMIVTDSDGRRFPMRLKEFDKRYQEMEKNYE